MSEQRSVQEEIKELYQLYSQDLYRFARMMTGNDSDAYDVVQEVFIRVFHGWSRFRKEANTKTWLFSLARNYQFDVFRKKRTERKYLVNYREPDPTNEFAYASEFIDLERALLRLKETDRRIIVLRHVEHFTIKETAEIVGWTEEKVRKRTHQALTKLRKLLNYEEVE